VERKKCVASNFSSATYHKFTHSTICRFTINITHYHRSYHKTWCNYAYLTGTNLGETIAYAN